MPEIQVDLPSPVAVRHRAEIERRLYFVSPYVTGFAVVQDRGTISRIVLRSDRPLPQEPLAEGIWRMIERDVLGRRQPVPRVAWQREPGPVASADVSAQLVERELVVELGPGQVALAGPLIGLVDYFDRGLRRLAAAEGGCEFRYPTLLPTTVLDRTGYLRSFPQLVMYVTWLHSDLDTYQAFLADYRDRGRLDATVLTRCDDVGTCLPPTMCFHTYGQYAGRRLGAGEHRTVTARGKAFRFESRYARSLERLWDFTIREVVFLGTKEHVLGCRRRFMDRTFALMEEWGLAGVCEVANDPFFGDEETSARIWSQRMLELKYELRLDISPGQTVAVGSFNYHDDFFGRGFDIRHGDGWAHTACVGFGLERLVYAFVCQFGLDLARWPEAVRAGAEA